MAKTIDDGVRHANECWQAKFNCAESVLRGVCHAQEIELPDTAKRMATPFGGGIGRSEDTCGALTGGVLAIGACIGRISASEDRLKSYDAAGQLFKMFSTRFGSAVCKDLNKGDFKSPEHRVRCGNFVEVATRLTLEILRQH